MQLVFESLEHLKGLLQLYLSPWLVTRPRGYTTFFMLNSNEFEISTAHKN